MSDRWATKVVAQVDLNLLSQDETAVLGYLSKMILAPVIWHGPVGCPARDSYVDHGSLFFLFVAAKDHRCGRRHCMLLVLLLKTTTTRATIAAPPTIICTHVVVPALVAARRARAAVRAHEVLRVDGLQRHGVVAVQSARREVHVIR